MQQARRGFTRREGGREALSLSTVECSRFVNFVVYYFELFGMQ